MNTLNTCPCCSNLLIHCIENHREYWFCRHCWSEMPNLESCRQVNHPQSSNIINLSTVLPKLNRSTLVSLRRSHFRDSLSYHGGI